MIVVGIKDGVVEICVAITEDQQQVLHEMYPDHLFLEQVASESIGWKYDGLTFTPG